MPCPSLQLPACCSKLPVCAPPACPAASLPQRELGRLIPDAAGRPELQAELEGVQTKVQELLYLLKQLPESMQEGGAAEGQQQKEFLP